MDKLYYYKLIAESLKRELNLENVDIHFRDINRGHSRASGYISIPLWTLKYGKHFVIYYIIHELTHAIIFNRGLHWGHTPEFKAEEINLLKKFDIEIIYARAYPKELKYKGISVYKKVKR